jgi:Flp pilus assembly protein TadG
MTPRAPCRDDTGSAVVQFTVMVVIFVTFIALVVLVGRVNNSYSSAESAARYAARTISIARDPAEAIDIARSEAEDTVALGSDRCASMDFHQQIEAGSVTVTVTCQVDLSDVDLPGMPGDWEVTATAQEPIDPNRETTSP